MSRFFVLLRPLIRGVVRHPLIVLAAALVLSVVGVQQAQKLSIDTDLANLLPEDYASVQAVERLRDTVGAESEAAVAIESPSFEANRRFAEALIPEALALTGEGRSEPFLTRVEYRKDVTFLEDNALYFGTESELDRLETWLEGRIEDARLEANPFFFDLDDFGDEDSEQPDTLAEELQEAYREIVSSEYPVSEDSTTLVLRFYPSGSQTDIRFIEALYEDLQRVVDRLDPASFNPDMQVTLAGRLQRTMVEVRAISDDVLSSFGAGVLAVLLLVIAYFTYKSYRVRAKRAFDLRVLATELLRMPVMALVIGLPLLMSLSWTFGLAYLTYAKLNLMTSTLGLVLFGLGIDYGIHFYARYAEERGEGRSAADAIEETFLSTGQAITVGALTTAIALYVLVAADFRGFSQFGFMAGTGILFALAAMLFVLPAVLLVGERIRLLNFRAGDDASAAESSGGRFPLAGAVLTGSIVLVVAAVLASGSVSFEYRFGELEPTYAEYNARRDIIRRVYDSSQNRNPAYIVVDDPSEVPPIVERLREIQAADTLSPTFERVESLQERFPPEGPLQAARLDRLAHIRLLLADPFLSTDTSDDMERLRRAASTTTGIGMDEIPDFLRQRFTAKDGRIGNFVIIYPSVGLSDGRQSIAFSEDVGTVVLDSGAVYHAGSSSLIAADMLKLMQREAPWMVLATLAIVVLLMLVNFMSVRWALLALLPLMVGVLWMLLFVEILGLKLNFYNLIVLPAVLGIGNDAGVHMASRYRELGPGSIVRVLRSTGEHVTMGSLTTMVGFAGLLLSFHPGLESIGQLAVVGIGATLVAALVFLPSLVQWLEDRSAARSDSAAT